MTTPGRALAQSQQEMTVCNACRYCEAYCPVFQAMEQRLTFSSGDITYLANLCHNCGECLYACQYAPPHQFGINVPATFSALRVESYETAAWPPAAARAFRRPWAAAGAAAIAGALVVPVVALLTGTPRSSAITNADFYRVMSHDAMVILFGIAGLFAVLALTIGHRRFSRAIAVSSDVRVSGSPHGVGAAARDALTLQHLHATGVDCTAAEETRRPWRRWMHHCTFYGFLLCFASTSVAAMYHLVFGWVAPYSYTSVPVVLGTAGGLGLLIGPAGLYLVDRGRDPALTDAAERGFGGPFLALLFGTSATGLVLLMLRERAYMPALLIVHLTVVMALFITLPYGKFVHGIYRAAALVKFRRESAGRGG